MTTTRRASIEELRWHVGQGRTLLRQVDAELAQLRIRDLAVSRRLKRALAAAATEHDVPDDVETLPVDTGALLGLALIDDAAACLADAESALGELTVKEEELLRLDTLLAQHTPFEEVSGRSLLRQALRGRRGDRA